MPITRKEFEEAKDELAEKSLEFLAAHPDKAFTLVEIAEGMGWKPSWGLFEAGNIAQSVGFLVGLDKVKRKEIGGGTHYAISLPLVR